MAIAIKVPFAEVCHTVLRPRHPEDGNRAYPEQESYIILISSILDPVEGECNVKWVRVYDPDDMDQPGKLKTRLEDLPPPLYLVAYVSKIDRSHTKSPRRRSRRQRSRENGTAWAAACFCRHKHVVRLLLAAGAAVNAIVGDSGTALQEACRWGNKKSVHILLQSGANPHLRIGNHGTALQAASRTLDRTMVKQCNFCLTEARSLIVAAHVWAQPWRLPRTGNRTR